jgi:hypothetical protein
MGLPSGLPEGVAWDQSVMAKRLQGADTLITPPTVSVGAGLMDVPRLYGMFRRASNTDRPLEQRLSPELHARLGRAAAWVGARRDGYRDMLPWLAGVRLIDDFQKRVGLEWESR